MAQSLLKQEGGWFKDRFPAIHADASKLNPWHLQFKKSHVAVLGKDLSQSQMSRRAISNLNRWLLGYTDQ